MHAFHTAKQQIIQKIKIEIKICVIAFDVHIHLDVTIEPRILFWMSHPLFSAGTAKVSCVC